MFIGWLLLMKSLVIRGREGGFVDEAQGRGRKPGFSSLFCH